MEFLEVIFPVARTTLMSTFLDSIAGVTFYTVIPFELNAVPDWPLGALFGVGGIVGMCLGARAQKYVPQNIIKVMIGVAILGVTIKYILKDMIRIAVTNLEAYSAV
jgi:uncharacterized membrane protein YfcA